jgi:hypothetical protein
VTVGVSLNWPLTQRHRQPFWAGCQAARPTLPTTNDGQLFPDAGNGAEPLRGALGRHFGWQFNDARDQSVQRDCASERVPAAPLLWPGSKWVLRADENQAPGGASDPRRGRARTAFGWSPGPIAPRLGTARSRLSHDTPSILSSGVLRTSAVFCVCPQHPRGDTPCTLLKSLSSVIAWSWRTLVGTLLSRPTTAKVATTSRAGSQR